MRKKLLHGAAVGLVSALAALGLWSSGILAGVENIAWSWRVRLFAGASLPSPRIKVILLDQYSLDWGKNENGWSWPWPRVVYTAILDFCRRAGARAVAFDILYTEPSVYGVDDDNALGDAFRRGGTTIGSVYLGTSGDSSAWPEEVPESGIVIAGLENWLGDERNGQVLSERAAFPVFETATNVTLLANVSDLPDYDGVFRRATLFKVFDGRVVPALGLAAYLAPGLADGELKSLRIEDGWLHVDGKRIALDGEGRSILNFRGHDGRHESYNAAAVIASELRLQAGEEPLIDPEVFRDAYAFFGTSAPGLLDLRSVPISKVYPGVEIYATMLDNLLSARFLRDAPGWIVVLSVFLLSILSSMFEAMSRKTWHTVVAFAVCLPVPIAVGFWAYAMGFWWPVAAAQSGVLFALVGAVVLNYATEGRQKAFIKQAFRHYLGETVIDQLLEDPSRLTLGGEKRELTLFFSDIEKFSSFSERLEPSQLTALLNEYLTDMGAIIKEEGGYLDKYIGDAIVAFWNAPVAQADHATRAVRAALRCQRKLAERRGELERKYKAVVKMRIGLNSGDVTVGNMGSNERFNYTVLGDAANLASRLEGANKAFGMFVMIAESTWLRTNGDFIGREIGQIRVVGRTTPVRVFEVVGFAGEEVPEYLRDFEKGLKLCRERNWTAAMRIFERQPDDPVARVYAQHMGRLVSDPSQDWDGIWNLTEK